MNRKNMLFGIAFLLFLIGIISGVVALTTIGIVPDITNSGDEQEENPDDLQMYIHECTVRVHHAEFIISGTDAEIESVSCMNTKEECGRGFFDNLFDIFTMEGTVQMWDMTGKIASEDYQTSIWKDGRDDTITIEGCSAESTFTFVMKDDEGTVIATKSG